MRRLAPDLADVEIEFNTHKSNFLFLRDCITKQLELFKGYE